MSKAKTQVRVKKQPRIISSILANPGTLIIVGGHEDKENAKIILSEIAQRVKRKLVVASVASEIPEEMWSAYQTVFKSLGVKTVEHLMIERSEDARNAENLLVLDDCDAVFFTGGDQLRITTKLGGTKIMDRIYKIYKDGGLIAGTSAGASIMGEYMLLGGENDDSHKIGNWMMAPGLSFLRNIIIDQHFAQRGRMGRLLGAVAQNPGLLGMGIDEDTAVIYENDTLSVVGSSAVYVVDGRSVTHTNVSEAEPDRAMSLFGATLHVLSSGDGLDLRSRIPNHN